jgi:hypothetical protein
MSKRPARRNAEGVVYTPPDIVRQILRLTLASAREAGVFFPRLLDPACGAGAFLVEAYLQLLRQADAGHDLDRRIAILRQCVFGIDTDHSAVEVARRRLAAIVLQPEGADPAPRAYESAPREVVEALRANLRCGDALADDSLLAAGSFQVIVANPPFIGARRLARRRRVRDCYQDSYSSVQGSCDLYVVFLERICELLAEGGRYGVIAPNRIAIADYARGCRELLLSQTRLERIVDVSGLKAFPSAAVYPVILFGAKGTPAAGRRVSISRPESLEQLGAGAGWHVEQHQIDAARGFPLRPPLDLESRVPTRPLAELAALHSGTTGFAAGRIAGALAEREETEGGAWDFITTGSIDRYRVRIGDVRFLGCTYRRPVLSRETPLLTERKRRLYAAPKIVFAGLSRRPEAAWSPGGLALGVQVYAAADCREDPFYLLAILNSRLFAHLFRTRFVGRRMSGGYLAVTKSQLARLPIRAVSHTSRDRRLREDLAFAACRLTEILGAEPGEAPIDVPALERQIDAAVYELYELSEHEVATLGVSGEW